MFIPNNYRVSLINPIKKMRVCQNRRILFFYAQSPNFPKLGLCYYPKFM